MESKYNLHWEEYEDVTRFIYGNLGHKDGIKIRGYGKSFKVKGKSGVEHQIDVLTEKADENGVHLTAIECKFMKKKVDKDIVMKLQSIMVDAGIQSGIIVCKAGYTKATKTYAEHVGIRLVELWEADGESVKPGQVINFGTLDLRLNITCTHSIISEIDLGFEKITGEKQIMAMNYVSLVSEDGREVRFSECTRTFSDALYNERIFDEVITRAFKPSQILYWNGKEGQKEIREIKITGHLKYTETTEMKYFNLVDHVWLVMEEIFEKRRTTLSKSGMMYNLPYDEK